MSIRAKSFAALSKEGKEDEISERAIRKMEEEKRARDKKRMIVWLSVYFGVFLISLPILASNDDSIEFILLYSALIQGALACLILSVNVMGNSTRLLPIYAIGLNLGEIDELTKQRRRMLSNLSGAFLFR